jgi:hypothetical protein
VVISISINDLLKTAESLVSRYITRINAARERQWEQILAALEMLKELTGVHVKAINQVVEPVLERRDLLETCRRYRILVHNDDLPRGYGGALGVLKAALNMKQFKGRTGDDNPVNVVIVRLYEFQQAAFILKLSSHRVEDMLEHVEELWLLLSGRDGVRSDSYIQQLRERAATELTEMMDWLRAEVPDAGLGEVPALDTPDEVVEATRTWCKGWQRHAEMTLYGRRGLNYAIGQLKMLH